MSEILIEVCYAEPERSVQRCFRLPDQSDVAAALKAAAADPAFAGIDIHAAAVGIFGKIVAIAHKLEPGDRVELYQPLAADPKTARRARARSAAASRRGQ